jgi:L-xylulokinase
MYLLGIDSGGTVTKVALFDLGGREIGRAAQRVEPRHPQPGWAERDLDQLWQSTAAAIRTVVAMAGIRPQEIAGVGTTGHGNGLYLLDRRGAPLGPGVLSFDTRAAAHVQGWSEAGLATRLWPRLLQQLWAGQPPALLRWIKQHQPERYRQIGSVLLAKDYLRFCLTGAVGTDPTDLSATGLFDLRARACTPDLLEQFGIPEVASALPPLAQSCEVVGRVTAQAARATGLAEGTPVVGGMLDVSACALGAGVTQPHRACVIVGTWSINQIVGAGPLADPDLFLNSLYLPGLWLTLEASPTSAANLEWFVAQCCAEEQAEARRRGVSVYEVCSEQVAGLPPAGSGVIFHPFLFGSNIQPSARAGFYGVAGWHTRAHLLRAIYEGIVYGHLSHIQKLQAAGAQIDSVRLTGGGARSSVWAQIFADTLGLPIEVPAGSEIGARGAAICAGVGVGAYTDYDEAVRRTVAVERRQEPNPEAAPLYRAGYAEYTGLLQSMREPWERLARLGR